MERALEIQRVKLLRLLAGWFAIVGFLSAGPLRLELPRWMRAFFAALLIRAEFAAQSLVWVAACVAAKKTASPSTQLHAASLPFIKPIASGDPVPSTQALLHRMKALMALLENLPRHGLRLLRRRVRGKSKQPRLAAEWRSDSGSSLSRVRGLADQRIDRPPDKARLAKPAFESSLPNAGGGWTRL